MKKSYSLGRFEYFVLAIVIGGIATIALDRYLFLADETRNLRFEMLANNFVRGAANARINWILQHHKLGSPVTYLHQKIIPEEPALYFSEQGWPMGITKDIQRVQKTDCYSLWQTLLQNSPPIAQERPVKGRYEYYLTVEKGKCRYYWNKNGSQNYYFEYNPLSGQVRLVIPEPVGIGN